ncbi:hypothetical protein [Maridesulfovibrio zosterae]|uniref:hypothetical protein n=1 Tax=Maridesulfovibrio zosterae TaxID=82171 RepID=UPI00055162AB|nr:hypothetical protein [Maridesulfovibrio zosterae]
MARVQREGEDLFFSDKLNEQEAFMQERFCKCGNRVMVQYQNKKSTDWFTRFWVMGSTFGKTIRICPECGCPLDINSLK